MPKTHEIKGVTKDYIDSYLLKKKAFQWKDSKIIMVKNAAGVSPFELKTTSELYRGVFKKGEIAVDFCTTDSEGFLDTLVAEVIWEKSLNHYTLREK